MDTVAELLRAHVGAPAKVEGTGGGCEALVVALEGGAHLVVSDNLGVPAWGDTDTYVGLFAPGAWHDSGQDAAGVAWSERPLTPDLLRTLIDTAMSTDLPAWVALHAVTR